MQRNLGASRGVRLFRRPKTPTASWEKIVGPIQRRQSLVTKPFEGVPDLPPHHYRIEFSPSLRILAQRLGVWLYAFLAFALGIVRDRFVPGYKDTVERRAQRLYHIIRNAGGSFLKIGQQLAIRIDLLPYEYYSALSKLFDEVEPFPFEQAVALIEKDMKRPLGDIFIRFDPDPVGSGSMAVIYQAILREDGKKVAVKVRRPEIGEVVTADFSVMRWLFAILKFFNLLPRIVTFDALDEIHDILIEELDFYWEARHTDMFRMMAEEAPQTFFSAPRIYFKYCTENVLVQEFITGIPLKDMLLLVENHDEEALQIMADYGINPHIVGQRLLWVNYYTLWRSLFFHADPHPGNIIVLSNNELVFVDFGAIGSMGNDMRRSLQQVFDMELNGNIEGAARVAITLMEPLPALDINKLLEDVKMEFQRAAVALRSRGVPWTERTSAQLWFGFFRVARKYDVPLPSAVVRMVRGTMLYDTLAARLDQDIDIHAEYTRFRTDAGLEARERLKESFWDRLHSGGLTPEDYLRLEQILNEGEQLFFQTRRLVNNVTYNMAPIVTRVAALGQIVYGFGLRMFLIWILPIIGGFGFFFAEILVSIPLERRFVPDIAGRAWENVEKYILNSNTYWTLAIFVTFFIMIVIGRRLLSRLYQLSNNN